MAQEPTIIVITDANIIINLFHIGQLSLFGSLPPYRFRVPRDVVVEILDPAQQIAVRNCIEAGVLEEIVVDTMAALPLFAELRGIMGRGEAACLALAATGGFHIASDEKQRFRRKAIELIGEARILRTEFLLLEAIRRDQIAIGDADHFKDILAANHYALPFNSFADILK
jgi:predicted nucleic acid-binding protein